MSRYDSYGGWAPYVPVATRRANARKQMDKLRKKGTDIQPVEISGRTIARSFWGKGWCDHLESFGDYSNRLPRGRTYARNGSVCHLAIGKGAVEAIVSGSQLYHIKITIAAFTAPSWAELKRNCTGKIGSLLELLQGRLSDEIMAVVTDRKSGLFPQPGEIKYKCDCPDSAGMCKHIAAVIYGIGARLDERPELLFHLRGVDHEQLISADAATAEITAGSSRRNRRGALTGDSLKSVFGIDLEPAAEAPTSRRPTASKTENPKITKKTAAPKVRPFKATPKNIARLRKDLDMSRIEFARAASVSAQSIKNWEEATAPLTLNPRSLAGLNQLYALRKE
jgi:uncharacterized Zn finger protein